MSSLTFSYYVTDPGDVLHSHITDLMIVDVDGAAHLYSSTRYDGVLRQWDIDGGVLSIAESQDYSGDVVLGGSGGLVELSFGSSQGLLTGGGANGALQTARLDTDGGFGATTTLATLPDAFNGFQQGINLVQQNGTQTVFGVNAGQTGLAQLTFDANGSLLGSTVWHDATSAGISALATASFGTQDFVLSASSVQNGITAREVDDTGAVINTTTIGADDGLWISAPSALEVAQVGNATYAILASAGSDSLSVIEIAPDGGMIVRDHMLDAREIRFGGASSLSLAEVDGKTYVIAGGDDDGLSVFMLLEGGVLVHRSTIEDTDQLGLDNISDIAAVVRGAGLDIFASSGSETGVTQLRLDTGLAGITQTAMQAGGRLDGTAGLDVLQGHDGDDIIVAGNGDDILRDGAGNDVMSGGAGADVFLMTADGEVDTITDFTVGEDKIDLSLWPMLRDISQLFIRLRDDGMQIIYGDEVLNVQSANGLPIDYRTLGTTDLIGASRIPIDLTPGYPGPATPTPPLGPQPEAPAADQGGDNSVLNPLQKIKADSFDLVRDAVNGSGTGPSDGVVINGRNTGDTLFGSNQSDLIFAGDGNDTVYGADGNDTLLGRDGDDRLEGGNGADTLLGGRGDDTLLGGNGHDMLDGGNGADRLEGGYGNDIMVGRGGADTFVFNGGADAIADFEQGIDQIVLDQSLWTGLTSAEDVLFVYGEFSDGRATINLEDGNSLIIEGVTDPSTFADDISLF